jgi:ornithine--oxo-acid transaminase
LFVCDEIQVGFGRTGKDWAWQHELRTPPDGIITAKAISGGITPVSAFVARKDIMKHIDYGSDGSTYAANPVSCAVLIAALGVMRDYNITAISMEKGRQLFNALKPLENFQMVKEIRGRGMLLGIDTGNEETAEALARYMIREKNVFCWSAHTTLRLSPAINIKPHMMAYLIKSIREAINEFEADPSLKDNYKYYIGGPSLD